MILRSTPDYHLDVNAVLLLQGLWSTALSQGQVALGVVIITVSVISLRGGSLPRWLAWFGVAAGIVAILRLGLITHIPLFIAAFQPTFLWIAAPLEPSPAPSVDRAATTCRTPRRRRPSMRHVGAPPCDQQRSPHTSSSPSTCDVASHTSRYPLSQLCACSSSMELTSPHLRQTRRSKPY